MSGPGEANASKMEVSDSEYQTQIQGLRAKRNQIENNNRNSLANISLIHDISIQSPLFPFLPASLKYLFYKLSLQFLISPQLVLRSSFYLRRQLLFAA